MKEALNILIFCMVMGTASGALLVGVNTITSAQISRNEELKLKSSVLDVLGVAYTKDNVLTVFKDNAEEVKKGEWTLYKGKDESVAFEFSGPGVWGAIYGLVCINPDHKTIRNIKIIHQEETPGLGSRIADKEYLDQFKNKNFSPKLVFVLAGKSKADNEVDMTTGATYSNKSESNKEVDMTTGATYSSKSETNNEVDMITGATYSSKALEKLLNTTIQSRLSLLK